MATRELCYTYPFLGPGHDDWPKGTFDLDLGLPEGDWLNVSYRLDDRTPRKWVANGQAEVVVTLSCQATRHREAHHLESGATGINLHLDPAMVTGKVAIVGELVATADGRLPTGGCVRKFWPTGWPLEVVRGQLLGRTSQTNYELKDRPKPAKSYVWVKSAGTLADHPPYRVGLEEDAIYVLLARELYERYERMRRQKPGELNRRLQNALVLTPAIVQAVGLVRATEEQRERSIEAGGYWDDGNAPGQELRWYRQVVSLMERHGLSFDTAGDAQIANDIFDDFVGDGLERLEALYFEDALSDGDEGGEW